MLDWTDADLLREVIRRRIVRDHEDLRDLTFNEIWARVCVSHIDGDESSQYLIDRALMRPRNLLDLISHCKGFAVNLNHSKIDVEDIRKGVAAYSNDLLSEFDLEIRDVFPGVKHLLYGFIGAPSKLNLDQLLGVFTEVGVDQANVTEVIDILLWYGFLGLAFTDGTEKFIFHVHYNMDVLRGLHEKLSRSTLVYAINPAFWPGLDITIKTDW